MTPDLKSEIQAAAEKYGLEHGAEMSSDPIQNHLANFALSQVRHYVAEQRKKDAEIAIKWATEAVAGGEGEAVEWTKYGQRGASKAIAAAIRES